MQLPLPRTTTLTSHPFGLEWTPDGTLYLDWLDSGTVRAQSTIWRLPHQVQQWEQLRAINQHCNNPTLQRIAGTSDKLGLTCIIGVKNSQAQVGAFLYDLPTATIGPLFASYQPPQGGYIWNVQRQEGLVSGGNIFSTLQWLTPQGTVPVTLTLQNSGNIWHLPESVTAEAQAETSQAYYQRYSQASPVGETGSMDWAWKTDQIAFWATLAPIGRAYSLLERVSWNLYILDRHTMTAQSIFTSDSDGGSVRWSPDGEWLAYDISGKWPFQSAGLYLWSTRTGKTYRVYNGNISAFAWAPSQQDIATIIASSETEYELWKFDVRSIINSDGVGT